MTIKLEFKLPSDQVYSLFVKNESFTDPNYGTAPQNRTIGQKLENGVINVDKPPNPSSHEVAAWVRKILRITKTGHGGTLDPQVTGCLPIATGRGTRAIQVLLPAGKEYIGIGKIHGPTTENDVKKALELFQGKIYQIPPVRSNVKRRLRVRNIYYTDFLEYFDRKYLFRVGCQAGTYIRKLCVDVGLVLGSNGHMTELRRTRSGPFHESTAITLNDLRDAAYYYYEEDDPSMLNSMLHPIETALIHLPFIVIRDSAIDAICHGAYLTAPGVLNVSSHIEGGSLVVIKSLKEEAVALGRATKNTKEILEVKSGIVVKTDRVLMKINTYPKKWKSKKVKS
ncbi:MAG: RNA-guided pseudouridylation complex pseudouridine synthase subunit Cbf5 [Candidatus Thorarchaeota archaeon]